MNLSYIIESPVVESISDSLQTIATANTAGLAAKVDKAQGVGNAGKALIVNNNGNVEPGIIRDSTKISFTEIQGLTDEQKTTGRENIDAASATNVADVKSEFENNVSILVSALSAENKMNWVVGNITYTGATTTTNTRIRFKAPIAVPKYGGIVRCDNNYKIRIAIYPEPEYSPYTFVKFLDDFTNGAIILPSEYFGYYFAVVIEKVDHEQEDISGDLLIVDDHIKVFLFDNNVQELNNKIENFDKDEKILINSSTHLSTIPTTGNYSFKKYVVENDEIVESSERWFGTDYIKCPKYLCFDFRDTTVRIMVYFFDLVSDTYVPRWDILNKTTSTQIKNYLGYTTLRNPVVEIPDGVYMKICKAVDGNVSIYGWDGIHFGCEISGETYTPYTGGNYVPQTYATDRTGITVSGDVRMVFAKPGTVIIGAYGRTRNGTTERLLSITESESHSVGVIDLPDGYNYFHLTLAVNVSDENSASTHKYVTAANLNDVISTLEGFSVTRPCGVAYETIKAAELITNVEWTCLARKKIASGGDDSEDYGWFRKGTTYQGIPYSSEWMTEHFYGWHISRHTFINAANDQMSKFYAETDRHGKSFGYGLVCSSFATLCTGWPCPYTNFNFNFDPKVTERITNQPEIGMVTNDGVGHCLLPETIGYSANDYSQYTIYESVSPVTSRRSSYSWKDNTSHNTRSWSYLYKYPHAYSHKDALGYPNFYDVSAKKLAYASTPTNCYDLTSGSITNGSARPYCGDKGVMTNYTEVKINIHDANASVLYIQRCTYNNGTFTPTGTATQISISSGTSQIIVPDTNLMDGEFYAVYTDTDATKEYFEYHKVAAATYNTNNETFNFSSVNSNFWYVVFWEDDMLEGETAVIPKSDSYTEYYKVYHPQGATGKMFFKGTLGAYCIPCNYSA